MRVFKNKWFDRWARREKISDTLLLKAAEEIVAGKVEVDLGGCLFKKRLPRSGSGKSGGYRVLVGYKKPNVERLIFLYAFAKNERANISDKDKTALRLVAESFVSSTEKMLNELMNKQSIREIKNHE